MAAIKPKALSAVGEDTFGGEVRMSPEFIDAASPPNDGIQTSDEDRQGLLPADEEYTDDD